MPNDYLICFLLQDTSSIPLFASIDDVESVRTCTKERFGPFSVTEDGTLHLRDLCPELNKNEAIIGVH